MSLSKFNHVKISGITAVVPEKIINIDDEIQYYDNDIKKLERNKNILGLGTRHVVENGITTLDLCEQAARNLIEAMKVNKDEIDCVIFVSTSHDYVYPASACIIQGLLDLSENCTCFDISGLACSGYVHGLLQAHALIQSGVVKKCLLLAGDIPSQYSDVRNRMTNMLFGDAGTATLLEYTPDDVLSYFFTGTQGKNWDKLIAPAGGRRLPIRKDIADIEVKDKNGNIWHLWDDIMRGMDVFKFTMNIGPKSISDLLSYSAMSMDDIDFFALHQANKQIIRTVANQANIPSDKVSSETFTKYGNCATAAVIMVLCDRLKKDFNHVFLCTFGVGLSWGSCILDVRNTYNGGVELFECHEKIKTREELVEYWINYFRGDVNV